MILLKRTLAFVLIAAVIMTYGSLARAENENKTIIDQAGRTVSIPVNVQRIIVPFPWALNMVCAMDGRNKVVGVSTYATKDMGFNALFPEWVKSMPVVGDLNELNKELVLKLDPDVVIHTPGGIVSQMESIGVPVVALTGKTTIPEKIRFIGKVIGKEQEAEELALYYEEKIGLAQSRTADIPEEKRKKVYHVGGPGMLKTSGRKVGSYRFAQYAGGILVSENTPGGMNTAVTMEQVMAWNPDLIVVGYGYGVKKEDFFSDSRWKDIKAVKTGSIYMEPPPHAACIKRHPSSCLGTLLLAKQLYPERFRDVDIKKEIEFFIKRFYGVDWKLPPEYDY